MAKNERNKRSGIGASENMGNGVFDQVIGGGTALIRGKKPTFTAYNAKRQLNDDGIITDPLGSWTGVPADDPYERPIQDADDL